MKTQKHFSVSARAKSFKYAFNGLFVVIKSQHNFWIHIVAAFVVVVAGLYFEISFTDWAILVVVIGLVISAELFNTAIEWLVDLVSPEISPVAGKIKDVAAAAVLVLAIMSVVVAYFVFSPYIFSCL